MLVGIPPVFRFNHWFDGMALMHRFHIRDSQVTYSSRFLRSDSYVQNLEKNRIVVSEFGTLAMPDPCKNIFSQFFSRFQMSKVTKEEDLCLYAKLLEWQIMYSCALDRS